MTSRDERAKADFASKKFSWIETLCMDPRVTDYQKAAGIILLAMVNRADGYAWPSLSTIGTLSGKSEKAARDMTARLEALGYLRIERNTGRANTNRFWPVWVDGSSPVTDAARALRIARDERAAKGKRSPDGEGSSADHHASGREKGSLATPKTSPAGDPPPHRRVTRTLEVNPDTEPSSETNVSAAAVATARLSGKWKGSEGDPIPEGFPDAAAMRNATNWAFSAGAGLDVVAEREAFRRYHFSVRCLLTDWDRSWEMWIDDAISREQAA